MIFLTTSFIVSVLLITEQSYIRSHAWGLGPIELTTKISLIWLVYNTFAARRYDSVVYAGVVCPSVRLSVRLSQAGIVPNTHRITQKRKYDNPGTLVFLCKIARRNSNGVTPTAALNTGGTGWNRQFSTNISLKTAQDRDIV